MLGKKSARSATPSIEVQRNGRDGVLQLKVTGIKLTNYTGEKDFANLDAKTKEIVMEALKLEGNPSINVEATAKENTIYVWSDQTGLGLLSGSIANILGVNLLSVVTRRGRYAPPTFGFNPR